MSEYSVGISIDDIIEAEDKLDAKTKFFESLSWKQCYASEIEPQAESEDKEAYDKLNEYKELVDKYNVAYSRPDISDYVTVTLNQMKTERTYKG